MVNHKLVHASNDSKTMLTFEDAVELTNLLQEYINTDQGKQILEMIGKKFGLKLKDEFTITNGSINKNCPDCSGCHQGNCILGCMKTPGFDLCYWDEALEKIVGAGLVTHELGHIWHAQAYENNLDPDSEEFFNQSEEYAQYVEKNFTDTLVFCQECQEFVIDLKPVRSRFNAAMDNSLVSGIITGIGFGIGGFVATLIIGIAKTKSPTLKKITE